MGSWKEGVEFVGAVGWLLVKQVLQHDGGVDIEGRAISFGVRCVCGL